MGQVNTFSSWQIVKVVGTTKIASKTKEITFKYPHKFNFTPGQYVKIRMRKDGVNEERYYSVCSVGRDVILKIAVEKVKGGKISKVIHDLKAGDMIEIKGPMGSHFELNRPNSLFISGGIGITPFMSVKKEVIDSSILLASFKHEYNIPWIGDLKKMGSVKIFLTSKSNIKSPDKAIHFRRRRIDIGNIKEALIGLKTNKYSIYICGSTRFVEGIRKEIEKSDIKDYKIFSEMFG